MQASVTASFTSEKTLFDFISKMESSEVTVKEFQPLTAIPSSLYLNWISEKVEWMFKSRIGCSIKI